MIWRLSPPVALGLLYFLFILFGALLLSLPLSNRVGLGLGDALFTSVSAVTVTGLAVVDTGTAFTLFGQAVIALLIQLGGLGLMSFAVLVVSALGLPVGMGHRLVLREEVNQTAVSDLAESGAADPAGGAMLRGDRGLAACLCLCP